MMNMTDPSLMPADPHLTINPILQEVYDGNITNYSMFRMRMDVSGFVPDSEFIEDLIFIAFKNKTAESILIKCIKNGLFVDFFRDWSVFSSVLRSYHPNSRYGKTAINIIQAISEKRPGILIGHYLKNGKFGFQRKSNWMVFFEDAVKGVSDKISAVNEEYRVNIHPKVMEIIEENRTIELALK